VMTRRSIFFRWHSASNETTEVNESLEVLV
jgi:hypothetical protein